MRALARTTHMHARTHARTHQKLADHLRPALKTLFFVQRRVVHNERASFGHTRGVHEGVNAPVQTDGVLVVRVPANGWLVGWLVGWLIGWRVGSRLVGWFVRVGWSATDHPTTPPAPKNDVTNIHGTWCATRRPPDRPHGAS